MEKNKSIIVCAALRHIETKEVIIGIRHYCPLMRITIRNRADQKEWLGDKVEQGFVDQYGSFYTREEAWKIAVEMKQIRRPKVTGLTNTLYSEHLY